MRLEEEPLYIGEIVAITDFSREQVQEAVSSMVLMELIKEQVGFKQNRFLLCAK